MGLSRLLRPLVAVGLGFVVLSYLSSFVAYQPSPMEVLSPSSTYTPDLLTQLANVDNMIVFAIGLLAVGSVLQVHRLVGLYRRGICHDRCALARRRVDVVLLVLGSILLSPVVSAVGSYSSIWTDPTFYLYGVFGVVLVGCSVWCVLVTNRLLGMVSSQCLV